MAVSSRRKDTMWHPTESEEYSLDGKIRKMSTPLTPFCRKGSSRTVLHRPHPSLADSEDSTPASSTPGSSEVDCPRHRKHTRTLVHREVPHPDRLKFGPTWMVRLFRVVHKGVSLDSQGVTDGGILPGPVQTPNEDPFLRFWFTLRPHDPRSRLPTSSSRPRGAAPTLT